MRGIFGDPERKKIYVEALKWSAYYVNILPDRFLITCHLVSKAKVDV